MSSKVWQQTIVINELLAKQLLEQQIGLQVTEVVELGSGWDNIAYLINKQYVFRFPRRAEGITCLENEIRVLPYIKQHVSFPFSCPTFIGFSSQQYQAPFAGYQLLQGVPLSTTYPKLIDDVLFAKELASWLKQLHSIPVRDEDCIGIQGDQNWRYDVPLQYTKIISTLTQYDQYFQDSGFVVAELISAFDQFKKYDFLSIAKESYCHGDLYGAHILVENDCRLMGIIDWGDVHIGNPGIDLSVGFRIFSDKALSAFLQEYGDVGSTTRAIALFTAFRHSIRLLPYCYEEKQESLKEWTILSLSRSLQLIKNLI